MRTAIATAAAVEIICPHPPCGETIEAPNGSLFWTVEELRWAEPITRESVRCCRCGRRWAIPKRATI